MPRRLELRAAERARAERAAYVVRGAVTIDGRSIATACCGRTHRRRRLRLRRRRDSRVMVIGGEPLGRRHIWWNFVSSSKERIEQAKRDWVEGRIGKVPGDDEFIPLPDRDLEPVRALSSRGEIAGARRARHRDGVAATLEARRQRAQVLAAGLCAAASALVLSCAFRLATPTRRLPPRPRAPHRSRGAPPPTRCRRACCRSPRRRSRDSARSARFALRIVDGSSRSSDVATRRLARLLDGPVVALVPVAAQLVGRLAALRRRRAGCTGPRPPWPRRR